MKTPKDTPGQLDLFCWTPEPHAPSPVPPAPPPATPPPLETRSQKREHLHARLKALTGMVLELTVTDNRRSLMVVRHTPEPGGAKVRLHHMFLDAPDDLLQAVAHWIRHPRSGRNDPLFRAFFAKNMASVRPARTTAPALNPRGAHHDLGRLFDEENARWFEGRVTARIGWGLPSVAVRRRARSRNIRFGSHDGERNLIRVHAVLDNAYVPEWVVRSVVHHEMLHAVLGVAEGPTGRRRVHPPEFRRLEREHPDYARAAAWLEEPKNLKRLLADRTRR
ncbi:MAG TPA: hypothetical protein PKL54_06330 [Candidatus Hydrogenedentes bacterium]|nr:hypothetical protein [Candidatus Hydrogenedentota bacterium]HPA42391.1 hypothetical protein [Candidatus Hydrogenedentota bacterium]HQL94681.1 hypothetical protein [Candidatus Hydrogenedentota bacterium]